VHEDPRAVVYAYDAFVSYSHAADNELAPVLQKHLQSFAKPFWQLRSLRVFRDDTTLTLTPHLWPTIRDSMDKSRYFVLLAAPQAAQSRWVQQEVSHWVTTRGTDTLLIVLTDGVIEWDDKAGDFDWTSTTALPPTLRGAFKDEPKWEDVSALINPADLTMQNPVLRKTVASLYSAITGRPLDWVIGEDVRQHRRTRLAIGATAVTLLAGVVGFGAYYQYSEREQALEQQRTAQQRNERIVSQSRYVAEQVKSYTERGDTGLAMNLLLEDLEPDPSDTGPKPHIPELHFALFGALHSHLERTILGVGAEPSVVAVSAKEEILVAAGRNVLVYEPGKRQVRARLTHGAGVGAAQFNRDGTRILTAAGDGKARVWPASGGAATMELAHAEEVLAALYDPAEQRIATGSRDDTAVIWDAASGAKLHTLRHEGDVVDLAWDPSGTRLYTLTRIKLRAFEAATGRPVLEIPAEAAARRQFRSMSISRDGARLATVSLAGAAQLWNAADGSAVGTLQHGRSDVRSASFSPTDDLLATTGSDLRVVVWDSARGHQVYSQLDHNSVVTGAAFSGDGSRLMTWSSDNSARVYSACDGRELAVLQGHTQDISTAAFTADGCGVVTGSGDATARVWSLVERPGQTVLTEHRCTPGQPRLRGNRCRSQEIFSNLRREYLDAVFSKDGTHVATGGTDRIARVYEAASGKLLAAMPEQTQSIRTVGFDATGKLLLAAQGDLLLPDRPGLLRVWDWQAKREVIAGGIVHTGAVLDAQPSPDGTRWLTASGDGLAQIFDGKTGQLQLKIELPASRRCGNKPCMLGSARWSPDGTRIATASHDYTACVWTIANKTGVLKQADICVEHEHVVYTANWNRAGTHILTASGDQTAAVWDTRSGEAISRFYGDAYDFRSAEFFANDTQIVTSHNDYAVRFWHAAIGRELARVPHRQAHINSATLDAAGMRLLTASSDGSARIWHFHPDLPALAEASRDTLQRCLARRQREQFNINKRPLPSWCAGKLYGTGATERPPTNTQAAVSR
jgi:WD40 repeat protein